MYCQKCGKQSGENAVICQYCGTPVETEGTVPMKKWGVANHNFESLLALVFSIGSVVLLLVGVFLCRYMNSSDRSASEYVTAYRVDVAVLVLAICSSIGGMLFLFKCFVNKYVNEKALFAAVLIVVSLVMVFSNAKKLDDRSVVYDLAVEVQDSKKSSKNKRSSKLTKETESEVDKVLRMIEDELDDD